MTTMKFHRAVCVEDDGCVTVVALDPPHESKPFPMVRAKLIDRYWSIWFLGKDNERLIEVSAFGLFWRRLADSYKIDIYDGKHGLLIAPEAFSFIELDVDEFRRPEKPLLFCRTGLGIEHEIEIPETFVSRLSIELRKLGNFSIEVPDA